MKVLGNRVYIQLPEFEDSKIELSPEMKKQRQMEMTEKLEKLEVIAIGELVTTVKVGDQIYLDPNILRSRASFLKFEGKEVVSVNVLDISHIWD